MRTDRVSQLQAIVVCVAGTRGHGGMLESRIWKHD